MGPRRRSIEPPTGGDLTRWTTLLALTALLAPLGAHADTFVLRESHTEGHYSGGQVTPADDSTTETWIGDGRMATVTPSTKVIVDLESGTVTVVNLRDCNWAESPLPLDLSRLLADEDYERGRPYAGTGGQRTRRSRRCSTDARAGASTPRTGSSARVPGTTSESCVSG